MTAEAHVYGTFGRGAEKLRAASPTTYLAESSVPMLVISESQTHPYTKILEDAAKKQGKENIEFLHVPDRDHTTLRTGLGQPDDPIRERFIEYIARICGGL